MELIHIIAWTLTSVLCLLYLKKEKEKAGSGLPSRTGHATSRYRIVWLLIYAVAIPSALAVHLFRLIKKITLTIGGGIWRWLA